MRRVALLLALTLAPLAHAQTALTVGRAAAGSVAADAEQVFTLDLAAGRFVAGTLHQADADLVVTVTGPDGVSAGRFDESALGDDPFQFETAVAGTYRFAVTPFAAEGGSARLATSGAFTLTVARDEPVAATPEGRVDQAMARYGPSTPGAVVGVVRGGRLVFARAYGMADLTHGVPFTPETPTNIGSTSKQFTAFAVLALAAEGRVDLDADVRTYLPELPDLGATVTVRHLLTHTSGYREYLNTLALGGWQMGDTFPRDRIVEIVQRQPELQNAPGAEFNYNNTAFALAAQLVERVTGEPFPAWMAAHVFAPAGMTRTVVRASPQTVVPGRAAGYQAAATGGVEEVQDAWASMGAGGIYSTLPDLARWMQGYLSADPARRTMTTRSVLTTGDTTSYGMGLFVDTWRGQRRLHHGGADAAHRAQFIAFPDLDAGVIVLSNDATFDAGGTANAVAGWFFADDLAPAADPAAPAPAATAFDPATFDPATFDAYAGRYAMDEMPAFVLTFSREGEALFGQATGQPRFPLTPTSDSTFALTVVEASLTFHHDARGAHTGRVTLHQNGDHRATRLDDEAAAAPDRAAIAGRYHSDELDATYTLAVEDGALVLRHRRFPAPIPLAHRAGDAFSASFPISTVDVERDADGRVTGLRVGNGRTRDVRFARMP